LAQKSALANNGWMNFPLSTPIDTTPDAEYRLYANESGGTGPDIIQWKGGETGSAGTYTRGHAIMMGFSEEDFDFHFRTYGYNPSVTTATSSIASTTATIGGTTSTTGKGGKKTQTTSLAASQQPATVGQSLLPKPLNLRIWRLKLLGVGYTYADLGWDKVTGTDFSGYFLKYGETSGNYPYTIDTNNNFQRVRDLLAGKKYYFVVYAYD